MPHQTVIMLLLSAVTLAGGPGPTDNRYVAYEGTAAARQSSGFLYGERDVLEYRGARLARRITLYTCRDGTAFARKTVDYADGFAPDFALEDVATGMTEGLRGEGGSRVVFYRAGRGEPEKSAALRPAPGFVADAGFDEFVQAHWAELMAGQELTMRFLVPSHLKVIGFQVTHLRSDRFEGAPVEVLRLKLSGLWGYFLPGIDVYYRRADRILVRYVGLSDLRDAAHDNLQVDLTYRDTDRRATDAGQFDGARRAPLAPCARHPAGR